MISIDGQKAGRDENGSGWKNWLAGAACFVGLLAGTAGAEAQTRTLKLMNVHTGEKAEIVYRRGGSYDSAGLKKANYILRDWRKNQPIKMSTKVLDVLWEVYRNTGASGYIHVVCGYRSPATNSMLRGRSRGVAKKSQHMVGNAIDFYIPGVKLKTLRNAGLALASWRRRLLPVVRLAIRPHGRRSRPHLGPDQSGRGGCGGQERQALWFERRLVSLLMRKMVRGRASRAACWRGCLAAAPTRKRITPRA